MVGSHTLFVSFASGQNVLQASFLEQVHERRKSCDAIKLCYDEPIAGSQTHQVSFFQILHISMVDARLCFLLALFDQIQVALQDV